MFGGVDVGLPPETRKSAQYVTTYALTHIIVNHQSFVIIPPRPEIPSNPARTFQNLQSEQKRVAGKDKII